MSFRRAPKPAPTPPKTYDYEPFLTFRARFEPFEGTSHDPFTNRRGVTNEGTSHDPFTNRRGVTNEGTSQEPFTNRAPNVEDGEVKMEPFEGTSLRPRKPGSAVLAYSPGCYWCKKSDQKYGAAFGVLRGMGARLSQERLPGVPTPTLLYRNNAGELKKVLYRKHPADALIGWGMDHLEFDAPVLKTPAIGDLAAPVLKTPAIGDLAAPVGKQTEMVLRAPAIGDLAARASEIRGLLSNKTPVLFEEDDTNNLDECLACKEFTMNASFETAKRDALVAAFKSAMGAPEYVAAHDVTTGAEFSIPFTNLEDVGGGVVAMRRSSGPRVIGLNQGRGNVVFAAPRTRYKEPFVFDMRQTEPWAPLVSRPDVGPGLVELRGQLGQVVPLQRNGSAFVGASGPPIYLAPMGEGGVAYSAFGLP